MIENRAEKRADIETQVRIRSHSVADFIAEHSRDLSVGGVFVATNEPMAKHTLVKLEIGTDEEEPIRAVGRIIWTRTPEQASESAPAGMGIKFVKIGDDERARIAALVEKAGEGAGSRAPREDEEESPPEEASEPEEPVAEPTEAQAKDESEPKAEAAPAEAQPAEAQPAEAQPAEAQPAEAQPAEQAAAPEPATSEAKAEPSAEGAQAASDDEEEEEEEAAEPEAAAKPAGEVKERVSTPSPGGKKKKGKKERKDEARAKKAEKKKAPAKTAETAKPAEPGRKTEPAAKTASKPSTSAEPKKAGVAKAAEPEQGGFPVWVLPVVLAVLALIAYLVWGR